ncbi:hypothetical protein FB45DRAFT_922635 [Roridomyces roridus]|uniref:Uncharacterized protein n=1 Tax=Roridomyces roridus TaxID=1738132 RepID=A0AAD7BN86_9AGAR|nr:hypothetical protein FB45DRAFT_922635 [Roridomyces roridus]
MPAPETVQRPQNARPVLGHVNLMADTLIANANIDDLRAIVRSMVASATPGVAAALTSAARDRLQTQSRVAARTPSYALFVGNVKAPMPTSQLYELLKRARALYGSGMGFASLGLLALSVRATIGLRWDSEGGDVVDVLAVIDADIAQAIQSCKEELEAGRVVTGGEYTHARKSLAELRGVVEESYQDVGAWGGEFPFERAAASLAYWKL